jgi:hypothetical protein
LVSDRTRVALFYITLNPVRAGLVSDYPQWPGALFSAGDSSRTAKKVKRPEYFFDSDKSIPERVELWFSACSKL